MNKNMLIAGVAAALLVVAAPVRAQRGQAPTHASPRGGLPSTAVPTPPRAAPVTVIGTDHLPKGAPVIIRFRAREEPHRLVLIDTTQATAADLQSALESVGTLTQRLGADSLTRTIQAVPKGRQVLKKTPGRRRREAYAKKEMAALRQVGDRTIAGYGRARAVEVVVPVPSRGGR